MCLPCLRTKKYKKHYPNTYEDLSEDLKDAIV